MTLGDLGSIGEFVAAWAVVISLIYLAYQIRDNTKTLKATSKRDVYMWWSEWCREMSAHPHGVLHNRSLDPDSKWEDFTYEEQTVIGYFCRAVVMRFESEYSLYESGLLEPEVWQAHRTLCHSLLVKPTWAEWWKLVEDNTPLYSKGFLEDILSAPTQAVMGPTPYPRDGI